MVRLVKGTLFKSIKNCLLWWFELEEVLLDIEVALNNRPLSSVDDEIQLPILTPNSFLCAQSIVLPELEPHHNKEHDLRGRAKYLLKCKKALWLNWTQKYLCRVRERNGLFKIQREHKLSKQVGYGNNQIWWEKSWSLEIRNCWGVIIGRDGVTLGDAETRQKWLDFACERLQRIKRKIEKILFSEISNTMEILTSWGKWG